MDLNTFKQSLLSFLDDGTHFLIGHIPVIIQKLEELSVIISKMEKSRFYASSLLILYDGSIISKKPVMIKMIDFSNCILDNEEPMEYPPTDTGPDTGYLLGLNTLSSNFKDIFNEFKASANESGHVLISSLTDLQKKN